MKAWSASNTPSPASRGPSQGLLGTPYPGSSIQPTNEHKHLDAPALGGCCGCSDKLGMGLICRKSPIYQPKARKTTGHWPLFRPPTQMHCRMGGRSLHPCALGAYFQFSQLGFSFSLLWIGVLSCLVASSLLVCASLVPIGLNMLPLTFKGRMPGA